MKPDITGPTTGPTNGLRVYIAMGAPTWLLWKRSLTLPPATLKNAALENPVKNRKTRNTAKVCE
jgi:hypothetical protein